MSIFVFLIISLLISKINSLDNERDILAIYVDKPYYKITGKKGTILFPGFCNDDDDNSPPQIDTTKTTYFTKEIKNEISSSSYKIECGPWFTDNIQEKCGIFCNFNESIPIGEYEIIFDDKFNYLNYEVYVQSIEDSLIKKENDDIIDLYSDTHYINLSDNKDAYELKFKINVYNNEKLFLYIYKIIAIDCKQQNNELICPINRTKFENHVLILNQINIVSFDKYGNLIIFGLIPEIKVIYDINKKQDIYIGITKLLTNYAGYDNYIVYETNVTDIQNINIPYIELPFDGTKEVLSCTFIKGGINPMLISCLLERKNNDEYISIKEIEEEIINEESIIYNFRIQPVKIEEKCKIFYSFYSDIIGIYPEVLDFQSKDSYEIEIYSNSPENIIGITFNEDKEDLKCSNFGLIKRCNVEESHFDGKESDYYYIKYNGYNNTKVIAYEIMPIKVIVVKRDSDSDSSETDSTESDSCESDSTESDTTESDSGNTNNDDDNLLIIILSVIGSIVVIIVICLAFYFFYYKKKMSNLEEDVMKTSFKV